MADMELDDARYEHHLAHRGQDNRRLVHVIWTAICVILVSSALVRCAVHGKRRRNRKQPSGATSSRLPSLFGRCSALFRAASLYSYRYVSVVRFVTIIAYAATISVLLLCVDAPALSTHFVDDIAFRAAWITVAQVPLVYLLATKCGPLNILTGLSYERINWIHRWTGRAIFVCATTHMAIMMSSISIADLMKSPDAAMRVVRYGVAAYGTLAWIAGTSIFPLRTWSYRVFHLNHWACTVLFLVFVAKHVPNYAQLAVYASAGIIVTDNCFGAFRFLSNNITVRTRDKRNSWRAEEHSPQVLSMGYPVKLMTPVNMNTNVRPVESAVILRISNVPFSWRPGQHVRLYIPKLGALEMHPFTPATCSDVLSSPCPPSKDSDVEHRGLLAHNTATQTNDMLFMIKTQSGFTKRLADYYSSWLALPCPNASRPSSSLTAYIGGPYGNPPPWEDFENIVLIATSTGVTYILSILDYLEQLCFEVQLRLRTRRIKFVWVNRHLEPQLEAIIIDLLERYTAMLRDSSIEFDAQFYMTCERAKEEMSSCRVGEHDPFAHLRRSRARSFAKRQPLRIINPNVLSGEQQEEHAASVEVEQGAPEVDARSRSSCETDISSTLIDDNESTDSEMRLVDEELDESCWLHMQSLLWSRPRPMEAVGCLCAQARHVPTKFGQRPRPAYISWTYGKRPDISSILSTFLPAAERRRSMVVLCSNQMVSSDAKRVVSQMNISFASGRRNCGVEVHAEGFG